MKTAALILKAAEAQKMNAGLSALPDANPYQTKSRAFYRLEAAARRIAEIRIEMERDAQTLAEELTYAGDGWSVTQVNAAFTEALK